MSCLEQEVTAVILAGGTGSRLWPLSRELYPKQLLSMVGEWSMLQLTILRAIDSGVNNCLIVASHRHRFYIQEQIAKLSLDESIVISILLEPTACNSAPALALAALFVDEKSLLWVMPADHILEDDELPERVVSAAQLAKKGSAVVFGVQPESPETGYGYIESSIAIENISKAFTVASFTEKPNAQTAQRYLETGCYFWNSGMLCVQASVYLAYLQQYAQDIYDVCCQANTSRYEDFGFYKYPVDCFSPCRPESIDYAVLEHVDDLSVVVLSGQWSDIGSWDALYQLGDKDDAQNVIHGDVMTESTSNSLLYSQSRLIATLGVEDIVVVETPDAVLVAKRDQDQLIKQVVKRLNQSQRDESVDPRRVYRPWGFYDVLQRNPQYELRCITIHPHKMINTHCHADKNKQWTVLEGEIKVYLDGELTILSAGQSVLIEKGVEHQMENGGGGDTKIVESMIYTVSQEHVDFSKKQRIAACATE